MTNKRNTIMSIVIIMSMLCLMFFQASATSVDEAKAKQAELEKKISQNNEKLNKLGKQAKDTEEYQNILNAQIKDLDQQYTDYMNQIIDLNGQIEEKNREINSKNEEIDQKQQEIAHTEELFKKRMKAMYIAGQTSLLDVLLSSNSFGEFLSNLEVVKRISAHDKDIIKKLSDQKAEIEAAKQEIVSAKQAIEDKKQSVVDTQRKNKAVSDQLNTAMLESQKAASELAKNLKSATLYANDLNSDLQKQQRVVEEAMKDDPSPPEPFHPTEGFAWPLPGYSTITSGFGWRTDPFTGETKYHSGIDISGGNVYGKPIIASKGGRVIIAYNSWTPASGGDGTGYGNYVAIDHGGGQVTLYAHSSNVIVHKGDTVSQGQTIAYVGSTGNSSGPHLHFEVRINGTRVNPQNYVSYGR